MMKADREIVKPIGRGREAVTTWNGMKGDACRVTCFQRFTKSGRCIERTVKKYYGYMAEGYWKAEFEADHC